MDIGGLGDVGPDEQRPSAGGFDLACNTVAAFGAASSDEHLSSFPGERQLGGAADPRTSTGDQDDLVFHLTKRTPARRRLSYRGRPQVPNPAACQAPKAAGIPRLAHWSYTSSPRPA